MRTAALILALLPICVTSLRADEIHLTRGKPRLDVRITEETYESVTFRLPGIQQDQTFRADQVKEVLYADMPEKYRLALDAMAQGDYRNAIALFRAEAADPPKTMSWVVQYALFNLAECERAQGNFDAAIRAYDDLLKTVPKTKFYGDVYLRKAECLFGKGDHEQSKAMFAQLKSDAASRGLGQRWELLSDYYLIRLDEKSNPQASFQAYEKLREQAAKVDFPDVGNLARLRLGYILIEQKKIDDARSFFEEIIEDRQASAVQVVAGAYNGLGTTYLSKGEPTEEDYHNAQYKFLRVIFHYGDQLGKNELLAEALYWAGRCLEVRRDNPEINQRRARSLYARVMEEYPTSEWAKRASER